MANINVQFRSCGGKLSNAASLVLAEKTEEKGVSVKCDESLMYSDDTRSCARETFTVTSNGSFSEITKVLDESSAVYFSPATPGTEKFSESCKPPDEIGVNNNNGNASGTANGTSPRNVIDMHANASESSRNQIVIDNIPSNHSNANPDGLSPMKLEEKSFYSARENEKGDDSIWGLLSGALGNIYEWYDFAVYGLLASEIGASFFPQSSEKLQLINSFGVYLAAFIMRPIGAILFGEIGDRLWGRKYALIMSIVMITVPSVIMGLLPTYDMIGPAAPILLVFLRMLQGLSVGGQLAGSYVLSIEQSTPHNRGFRGSICDASAVGGFLMASAVTTTVRLSFSEETVNDWAWRIPFWFSLLLAPLLYHIVNNAEESEYWEDKSLHKETEQIIREEDQKQQTPAITDLLSSPFYRRQLFGMIGVLSTSTSSFYILFLWTPLYLSNLRELISEATADMITFCVVGTYIMILVVCGKLSDTFPHRMDLMRIGYPGIMIACPLMFIMFESESIVGIILAQLQFAVCLALVNGGIAAWEVELWMPDPSLSFTGVAVGHNVAATIFGGTMPLIATSLFYFSEEIYDDGENSLNRMIPGLYVSILAMVSFYCISNVIRHPHDVRTGEKKIRDTLRAKRKKRERERLGLSVFPLGSTSSLGMTSFNNQDITGREGTYCPPIREII